MAGTREIPLTKGAFALVDEEDLAIVNQYKWHLSSSGYAVWRGVVDGKKRTIRMHRLINSTPDGLMTDHLNHNRLDNRKANLRSVTAKVNVANRISPGYCFDSSRNMWLANYKGRHWGRYSVEQDAIEAVRLARSGADKEIKVHPRRKYLPKGVFYMSPQATRGLPPYYVRPQVNGKRQFKGYYSRISDALNALEDLRAVGGLTS